MIETVDIKILALLKHSKSEAEGYRLLVNHYSKPIYWHIRRLIINHEDARDLTQECFIKIYKNIGRFRQEASLKTWIYKIATNEAIDHCNKKKLDTESYDENNNLIKLFNSSDNINFSSLTTLLQRAMLSLPDKQRIVFNLRYYDDLNYEEIAKVTGNSIASLKTNYHYAQSKIKEFIINNQEV